MVEEGEDLTEVEEAEEVMEEAEEDMEEAEVVEDSAEVVLIDKTMVLRNMLSHWESSCIHVKMTLCASVQQRKTKFPTSTLLCTWKTRSRLGRWMRYSASYGTFIFQSNFLKI